MFIISGLLAIINVKGCGCTHNRILRFCLALDSTSIPTGIEYFGIGITHHYNYISCDAFYTAKFAHCNIEYIVEYNNNVSPVWV